MRCPNITVLVFVYLLFLSPLGFTHPHNWIKLNSEFVLDDSAHLVSVTQRWEFDIFYSLMTYADILNEFGEAEKGLPKTADRMIKNLRNYRYFSALSIGDQKVELGIPSRYALHTRGEGEKVVLELEMTFKINDNIKVEHKALEWKVYDPTYYIAMNHESERSIQVTGGDATECAVELKYPDPSQDLIEYAQSLDRTQRNTNGLGEQFAETAIINCI